VITGDPGPTAAVQAQFNWPHDLLLKDGNLYIAPTEDDRIRVIFGAAPPRARSEAGRRRRRPVRLRHRPGGSSGGAGTGQSGYWMLGSDAKVFGFGAAQPMGDATAALPATAKAVHIDRHRRPRATGSSTTPATSMLRRRRGGRWCDPGAARIGEKVTSLSATPSGRATGSSPRRAASSPSATPRASALAGRTSRRGLRGEDPVARPDGVADRAGDFSPMRAAPGHTTGRRGVAVGIDVAGVVDDPVALADGVGSMWTALAVAGRAAVASPIGWAAPKPNTLASLPSIQ